jgi:hypothetical protein
MKMTTQSKTLKADGFDTCVIGIGSRFGMNIPILVYDYEKCAQLLVDRDGGTIDEAYEYMVFNVLGAWVGEGTPMFVRTVTSMEEIDEILSDSEEIAKILDDGLDIQGKTT